MRLDCAGHSIEISQPQVMGILNVTPDSFSDGGRFIAPDVAIAQALRMVAEGAAIIDIGGESTRPGAQPVSVDEELARVIPVIEAIAAEVAVPISIDTSKPEVMRAAVQAGAGLINDVYALRLPGALEAAAAAQVPVCLMHMLGEPRSMQVAPHYTDVVEDVATFLEARIRACVGAGIPRERIIADPGFGFGKSLQHNLSLFRHLPELQRRLNLPLLVGVSRKSMIGAVLDAPVEDRLHASVALAGLAAWMKMAIIRVHDVKASVDAVRMICAVSQAQ